MLSDDRFTSPAPFRAGRLAGAVAFAATLFSASLAEGAEFETLWSVPVPAVSRALNPAEVSRDPAVSEAAFLPDGRVALQFRFSDGRRQWMIGTAEYPPEPGPEQPRFSNYHLLRTDRSEGIWGVGTVNMRIVEDFPPTFRHQDILVTRFDDSLEVVWESALTGNDWRYPYGAATLGADLVVTGQLSSGTPRNFLARIGEAGDWQWMRVFGIGTHAAVAALTDGTIVVSFVEASEGGAGDAVVWLFDADGNAKARAILRPGAARTDPDELTAMAALADGGFAYVASEFNHDRDFTPLQVTKINGAGEVLWQTVFADRPPTRPCTTAGSPIQGPQLALAVEGLIAICGADLYAIDPQTGAASHETIAFPACEGEGGHYDLVLSPTFARDRLAVGLPIRMGESETCAWLGRLRLD